MNKTLYKTGSEMNLMKGQKKQTIMFYHSFVAMWLTSWLCLFKSYSTNNEFGFLLM